MARAMMHAKSIPLYFWAEALNTARPIHNQISLWPGHSKTNYEIWKGWKPNVKYFHIFESQCRILGDKENHRKWDSKSDLGIFLGYSTNSWAYCVFSKQTKVVMESINIIVHNLVKVKDDDDDVLPKWSVNPTTQ